MKTNDLIQRLHTVAHQLEDMGFGSSSTKRTAEELARALGGTTLPLWLFVEWVIRTPEAQREIDEFFRSFKCNETQPANMASGTGGSVKATGGVEELGKWSVTVDLKAEPVKQNQTDAKAAAQKSEAKSQPGAKGATAASRVVNLGNAASVIGQTQMRTRPVTPADVSANALGNAPGFRGQAALLGDDGKTLLAVCRFNNGERLVEFIDKRGPLIMCRLADGEDKGTIVNICIEFVEPGRRAAVLEVLNRLPGANDGFNFSPFDGLVDPWNPDAEPIQSEGTDSDQLPIPN